MSVWGRAVAAGYDFFTARVDARGGEQHRRRLVADAAGEVLEIGAGTGKNLPHYRLAGRVVALEPNDDWRARAARQAVGAAVPVEVLDGDAMALPFGDDTFDTVVAGLVLCTIPDPGRALREARRVLRPGGTLRFYEHVRSGDPRLARWQDRLHRPWACVAGGCRVNQDTVALIAGEGFELVDVERFDLLAVPKLVRPHVVGTALA